MFALPVGAKLFIRLEHDLIIEQSVWLLIAERMT